MMIFNVRFVGRQRAPLLQRKWSTTHTHSVYVSDAQSLFGDIMT